MDIGFLAQEEREVTVPFMDAEVTLRYVPLQELEAIGRKATRVTWDGSKKDEHMDPLEANRLLGRAAVRGWRGLTMQGEEFPFTQDNCDLLMTRWTEFAKFVAKAALDLKALADEERRAHEKNS
jgi:hypothetical protein